MPGTFIEINVSPSILFYKNIKVVRKFDLLKKINTMRQAILTSPLLFGRSTVGSPTPVGPNSDWLAD